MGLGSTLGSIGVALAGQPRRAKTPKFLPPGAPIGPTPMAPPAPPPPPAPGMSDSASDEYIGAPDAAGTDPGDDESYDYTKPVASGSKAMQLGGNIGQVAPGQPKYQSADDRLHQTLEHPPERPKTGIWRQLGGNLLMNMGGAIGQTLGSKLAYGDYPEKLREYQANVENQTLASKQTTATREEQRKIEQNQNQTAESRARREDLRLSREAADKDRDAARDLAGKKEAAGLMQAGARPYTSPPPVTADVPAPAGIPGLAPTQATVPSPPKPPNVLTVGGIDLDVSKKPQEYKTIEERLLAVMDDQTLPPEQSKQKQDQLIQAHNLLHPTAPIHGIETDAQGNSTLVVADPRDPGKAQKIPLGPIGKPQQQPTAITVGNALSKDQDALDLAATQYIQTRQMPSGTRNPLFAAAIIKRAAEKLKQQGIEPEQWGINVDLRKANAGALTDITKRQNQIGSFEKTASKNLDVFLNQAKQVVDSGSPLINQPLRKIQQQIAGDPRMAAFEAARTTAFTEVSRVLSGSMSAVLSDSARKEAEHIIRGDYTIPQMVEAVNVLRQDMANRMSSFERQKQEIMQDMGTGAGGSGGGDGKGNVTELTAEDKVGYAALPAGAKYKVNGVTYTKGK